METGYVIIIIIGLVVAAGVGAMNLATLFIGNECMESCPSYTESKKSNKKFLEWMLYATIALVILLCLSSSCASAGFSATKPQS